MWRVAYFLHSPARGNKSSLLKKKVEDTATGAAPERKKQGEELILNQKDRVHLTALFSRFFPLLRKTSLKLFIFSSPSTYLDLSPCVLCLFFFPRNSFITFHRGADFSRLFHPKKKTLQGFVSCFTLASSLGANTKERSERTLNLFPPALPSRSSVMPPRASCGKHLQSPGPLSGNTLL